MNQDKRSDYETRERILKLISDDEIASVSTAETGRLSPGDEYLDLEHLEQGVQRADGTATPIGRVLPRKAVQEATWSKILTQLATH